MVSEKVKVYLSGIEKLVNNSTLTDEEKEIVARSLFLSAKREVKKVIAENIASMKRSRKVPEKEEIVHIMRDYME